MLDRESQTSAEELAHQQERFDIHVMAFADRSPATVAVLQQAFGLGREAVERLLSQTPVVVKRGAPPEVAHALLDVLVPLGAQVVLLPAPPGSPPSRSESGSESESESESVPDPAAPSIAARWGGLDIDEPAPASQVASGPAVGSEDAAFASTVPPPPATAQGEDGELEFELGGDGDCDDGAGASEPPPDPADDGSDTAAAGDDLGLGAVPPLPRLPSVYARASARAMSVPPPPMPPLPLLDLSPPALPPMTAPQQVPPPPPRAVSIPPQRMPAPQQRMPAQASVALSTPRVAAPAAARPVPQSGVTRGQRMLEPGAARSPASLELALGREYGRERERERERREPQPRAASQEAARARRIPELELPTQPASAGSITRPVLPDLFASASERQTKPEPTAKSAPRPRPARALVALELVFAAAVLYFGLRLDDTVLHGNASLVSLALHGCALYALGAGALGLRP